MTDLTNDATFNLETGASGGQGSGVNGAAEQSKAEAAAANAARRAEELATNAAREVETRVYQARDWAQNQSETVREQVVEKPFVSIGTAFAAGIIFGMLLRR